VNNYNSDLVTDMVRTGAPLSDEGNQELLPLVRGGDKDAHRRMIEGNLSLVISIVDSFIGIAPQLEYLRDDMTSAGYTGLVKAVNKIVRVTSDEKVTSYLSVAIRRDTRRFISDETTIYVPQRSQQAVRAQGGNIEQPVVVNTLPEMRRVASCGTEEVDVRDVMASCCICKEERILLRMREEKCTWGEIAEAIGKKRTSTYMLGHDLENRIVVKLESLR
jgi:hypothetical protein